MVGKWFPRGRRPIDKKRHSSRGIAARKAVRPSFEFLEIRLTPASVSLVSNDLEITASTSASENITVSAPSLDTLDIVTTGTIVLGSGTTGLYSD